MADEHVIGIEEASELTAAYRASAAYENYERLGVAFSKAAINRLMNPTAATGLRCYFAHDDNDKLTLVLVAHDAEGNDLLSELAEMGNPCPVFCASANDLNR